MKILTWQNPGQLFVAQELINKVKSKFCGIKDKNPIDMITENEYKVARRIVAVSWAMLVLAIGLLVWVLVDYFTGDAKAHNFASVIINIALFTTLIVHNRKKIKQYKSENQ